MGDYSDKSIFDNPQKHSNFYVFYILETIRSSNRLECTGIPHHTLSALMMCVFNYAQDPKGRGTFSLVFIWQHLHVCLHSQVPVDSHMLIMFTQLSVV